MGRAQQQGFLGLGALRTDLHICSCRANVLSPGGRRGPARHLQGPFHLIVALGKCEAAIVSDGGGIVLPQTSGPVPSPWFLLLRPGLVSEEQLG